MTHDTRALYDTLGVAPGASKQDIRKAYRRLAKDLHPDRNPDPAAANRFKEVSRAHDVLSNDEQRKLYDEFGADSLRSNFDAAQARAARQFRQGGHGDPGGFESFGGFGGAREGAWFDLSELLGGARGRASRLDLEQSLTLDLVDALRGRQVTLSLPGGPATVNLPPGIEEGARLRVPGRGARGPDGRAGDLVLRIRVRPDPRWRREGDDLHAVLPITVEEAMFGAKVPVPTLDGEVSVTVPRGSQSGRRLRLAGKGVPGRPPGDLYAELRVIVPEVPADDGEARGAARVLSSRYRTPVR